MCTGTVFLVSSLVYFLNHCLELNSHISRTPLRVCTLRRLDIVGELQLFHCTAPALLITCRQYFWFLRVQLPLVPSTLI